ncbi:MAG: hypothetical protein JSU74_05425, partial [Candidatus Zixiibacteriota bacterium]
MSWITNLFSRHWRNVHFLSILLLSVVLIVLPTRFGPLSNQIILSVFYWPFAEVKSNISDLFSVENENRQLRLELTDASIKISMIEEAGRENARLRSALGFE